MSEAKHTPGPWLVNVTVAGNLPGKLYAYHITANLSGSVDPICERVAKTERGDEEDRANARLIAAAPDMREALLPMLRGKKEADYYCPDDVAEDHTVLISVSVAELRRAQAALAKACPPHATGKQE